MKLIQLLLLRISPSGKFLIMRFLNSPTFAIVMLLSISLFGCSKQSPVIERTEVLPKPTCIDEVEAAKLLSKSNAISQTTFQIPEVDEHQILNGFLFGVVSIQNLILLR